MPRRLLLPAVLLALLLPTAPAQAYPAVKQAMRQLNRLGCDAGHPAGRLDHHARTAVIRFQAANGLRQSGRLVPAVRSRLTLPSAVRCDRRPVPAGTGAGRRVVVSQRQNYLWLVRADGTVQAQGPMVDNTHVLHPGTYHAGSYCGRGFKIRRNHSIGEGAGLLLENFVRFAPCGIGFHRVPIGRHGQIHPDWILGTNDARSHGCIRVSAAMSSRIWGFVNAGTVVRVVR